MSELEVIGIYHADAGIRGELSYVWRKLSGGEGCALCDLTHRFVTEKSVVKAWRTQLRFSLRWLHLNELDAEIFDFVRGKTPCVIVKADDRLEIAISSDELTQMASNEDQLMSVIERQVEQRLN